MAMKLSGYRQRTPTNGFQQQTDFWRSKILKERKRNKLLGGPNEH
jgi:hypothetical protein